MTTSPTNEQPSSGLTDKEAALLNPKTANLKTSKAKSGDIVASTKNRTAIAKRESMAQAVQDGQEANRVYAQTFLTVLDAGTNEFSESLIQHLGGMREELLAVEDDEDFLARLMANGCGGALPTQS